MINTGRFIGVVLGFLLGTIGHELAHGFAADRLGDKTPRFGGRLKLGLKQHVDPVGTLVMPGLILLLSLTGQFGGFGFLYGYARPIPVTPTRLRNPKRDQILVALAGPATNLALAVAAGFAFQAMPTTATIPRFALATFTTVQAFLLVVNLLPLPPLDGSKILGVFLSPQAQWKLQEYGQYLLLFLIVIVIIPPFRGAISAMADPVCQAFTGFPCFL
jgi:Zn-dependent protease